MRLFVAALLLTAATTAHAQQASTPSPAFRTSGAFFALSVPDLAASRAWYERKLGLAVTREINPGSGLSVLVMEGGGLMVELIHSTRARAGAEIDPLTQQGLFKTGLVVDDFDATMRTLRERGAAIAYGPYPARDGQAANVIVRDTSGTLIQFFGRAPAAGR